MTLQEEHCTPCETAEGKLPPEDVAKFLETVPSWAIIEMGKAICLEMEFPDFATALAFVNRVGRLAEDEGHHPDISFGWGYAMIVLYTHSVDGLTRNDFILASKIDALTH